MLTSLVPSALADTVLGKTNSASCAIKPVCKPSLSKAFKPSAVISSCVLYLKFLTLSALILANPSGLSTISFLILSSDVVVQEDELLP